MSRVHQLRFQKRKIHVRRAFWCASFAGKTITQGCVQFRRAQRVVTVHAHFERGPDNVGAATRGHDFFASREKRRTHRRRIFAAAATTIALLQVPDERSVLKREGQYRLKWKLEMTREVFTQMIIDFVPAVGENFPWIKNVLRIERIFDCAHHFKQLIPNLLAHVFGARDTDAMLSRKRAFELPNQRGGLIGHLPKFFQISRVMKIKHGSHV